MGKNLTDYGISIVDVRSTGLRRYAKIFQRTDDDGIKIPVACVTDRDVMPDCAPSICINPKLTLANRSDWPNVRRWKTEIEITDKAKFIGEIKNRADGQNVKTFVTPQWTLEYELAASGLGEYMLETIVKMIYDGDEKQKEKLEEIKREYNAFVSKEEKASYVYSFFYKKRVSKAEFAQYFAVELEKKDKGLIIPMIPQYLKAAIEYASSKI